jgi:hypothetical protein
MSKSGSAHAEPKARENWKEEKPKSSSGIAARKTRARESNGTRAENESRAMRPGSRKTEKRNRPCPSARGPGNLGVIQHPLKTGAQTEKTAAGKWVSRESLMAARETGDKSASRAKKALALDRESRLTQA